MTARKNFYPAFFNVSFGVIAGTLLVIAFIIGIGFSLYRNTPSQTAPEVAQNVQPEDPDTVVIWSWNTAAKSLQTLIPEFNKLYPDIKVKVVEIPYNEANDKFRLAVTTGNGFPDVWDTEGPVTNEYIRAKALMDLTDYATPHKDNFVAYKWSEVSHENRIYGIPWDTAPVGLFYRRDLFQEAGVDPESIKTWDDYIEAGKKVTKDKNGDGKPDQYMTLMSRKADVQDTFQILLSQFGGSLFDAQGNPTIATDLGTRAIEMMKKIMDAGITADIGWWTPEFFAAIKNGEVASLPQGVWMGGQIKEIAPQLAGKWGVILLPAVQEGGIRSAIRGGSNLAIPDKAKHKTEAWKFIEFALIKKESQIAMYKQYNIFPALKTAYEDPSFHEPDQYFGNQVIGDLFIAVQDQIPPNYYYGPYYGQSTQILSQDIITVLNGQKSPVDALKNSETIILQRLAK